MTLNKGLKRRLCLLTAAVWMIVMCAVLLPAFSVRASAEETAVYTARPLRKRFDEEMTGLLLKYRWWDKSIEEINSLIPMLTSSDIEKVKSRIRELLG